MNISRPRKNLGRKAARRGGGAFICCARSAGYLLALAVGLGPAAAGAEPLGLQLSFPTADQGLRQRAEVIAKTLQLEEGDAAGLRRAVERFYRELALRAVQVEQESPGAPLHFMLIPYPTLAEVKVEGNRAIAAAELLSAMGVEPGQAVNPGELSQLEQKAHDFLDLHGHSQASVRLQCAEQPDQSLYYCTLSVREGPATDVARSYLAGAAGAEEQQQLLEQLGLQPGRPLSLLRLRKGLERLERQLRQAGYRRCQIDPPLIRYDSAGRAEVLISLQRGPRLDLVFSGNRGWAERDRRLRELIGWDNEENFSAGYFEEAVELLIRDYLSRGYPDVRAIHQLRVHPDDGREEHRFLINPGPRILLPPPQFLGNSRRSAKELRQFWRNSGVEATAQGYFVQDELPAALTALENNYRAEGFFLARVEMKKLAVDRSAHEAALAVQIAEGPQAILSGVTVSGNRALSREEILERLAPEIGQPLRLPWLEERAKEVMSEFRERGYLYAEGRIIHQLSADGRRGQVVLQIEEGPQVHFGEVFLQGNHYTRPEVIRRELEIKPGQVFSAEKLGRSQENLQRLGIFRSVEIRPLEFEPTGNRRDILIKVFEKKRTAFRFRAGFGSEEGIRGMGEVVLTNLSGTARLVTTRAQVSNQVMQHSSLVERKVIFLYREPRLLGNFIDTAFDFGGRFNLLYAKEQMTGFRLDRLTFTLGIDRDFARHFKSSFFWDLEYRQPYDIEDPNQIIDPLDQQRARFGSLGLLLVGDYRDDLLNTRRGVVSQLEGNLYQDAFFSEADFYKVKLTNNFFLPIYRRFRFAVSLRAGFSGTFGRTRDQGSTLIPLEKRFRLGGADSLRGFSKDSVGGEGTAVGARGNRFALGGNSMFNYMSELILPLRNSLEFVVFQDGGNAWPGNRDFDPTDIRTTAGAGLRYVTPVGPLRMDWGYVLDHRAGEDRWQLHFAVGVF